MEDGRCRGKDQILKSQVKLSWWLEGEGIGWFGCISTRSLSKSKAKSKSKKEALPPPLSAAIHNHNIKEPDSGFFGGCGYNRQKGN